MGIPLGWVGGFGGMGGIALGSTVYPGWLLGTQCGIYASKHQPEQTERPFCCAQRLIVTLRGEDSNSAPLPSIGVSCVFTCHTHHAKVLKYNTCKLGAKNTEKLREYVGDIGLCNSFMPDKLVLKKENGELFSLIP